MDKFVDNRREPKDAPAVETEPAAEEPREDAERELEQLVERIVTEKLGEAQRRAEERAAQAERLASMSEEERRAYDAESAREREAELDRREAELDRRELRAWAAQELAARGLPRELEQLADCGDEQACRASVDTLERVFREAVQRGVDERISRGGALPRSAGGAQVAMVQRMRTAAGLKN